MHYLFLKQLRRGFRVDGYLAGTEAKDLYLQLVYKGDGLFQSAVPHYVEEGAWVAEETSCVLKQEDAAVVMILLLGNIQAVGIVRVR